MKTILKKYLTKYFINLSVLKKHLILGAKNFDY